METKINSLSDANAICILSIIAQSRMRSGDCETALSKEIRETLKAAYPIDPAGEKATAGDLARQALLLLSEDPNFQAPLAALIDGPKESRFAVDPITTTAVITAALVILQTHVEFERDKEGKIRLSIIKKPARDTILKPLVEKLLSPFP